MTRVSGDWAAHAGTRALMAALSTGGHRAYFVGGCVRDDLAGLEVGDIDIATDATPDQVIAAAGAARLRVIPTGVDHGTVTVIARGRPHEVTTFRRDVETDGRRAVVAFTRQIAEDAGRRDFTINALYAEADGTVLDPTGQGLDDLAAGRVRFVGDAGARIAEDYLRILRYFRFQTRFGKAGPDPEILDAIGVGLDGLDTLSAERIGKELISLLSLPDPGPAVATMAATGVLARILPGADPELLPVVIHLEAEAGLPAAPLRRLAALGGEDVAGRLRLSKAQARHLASVRDWLGRTGGAAEIGYRAGFEVACDAVLLRAAAMGQPLSEGALRAAEDGARAVLPIRAADLADRFAGPALGAALRAREDRWIASGFTASRDALLRD